MCKRYGKFNLGSSLGAKSKSACVHDSTTARPSVRGPGTLIWQRAEA